MLFTEKSPRQKIRISIIDVIIVLTVLLCIAGVVIHYKLYESENISVTPDTCNVSILFEKMPLEAAERVIEGDVLYLSADGRKLGTVVSVKSTESTVYFTDANGAIVSGMDQSVRDVTVTVEVKGVLNDDGFYLSGEYYTAAGMEVSVYSKQFSGKGIIFEVKKLSE